MKKIFKIAAYILFVLLLLTIGVLGFFNRQYNKANEALQEVQNNLSDKGEPFFQFQFNKDKESELSLLPLPKQYEWQNGEFNWSNKWNVSADLPKANEWINRLLKQDTAAISDMAKINFILKKTLAAEGYELAIKPSGIDIHYKTASGAYYAIVTLHHLKKQFPTSIKCLNIEDEPDLAIRGLMHDISRDKVPQLHTLKTLVDHLSLLKYNHLQLYVEGFSFAYPSFKELWEIEETPITPAEIKELDAYCKERFIELVPNQNCLGHMQAWLETTPYADLAECPEGYELMPMRKVKTTIDPSNPKSIELVEQMTKDLLPNFSSNKFNANLDEPFELGHCNNKALADEIGVGQIYLDYVLKVYALAKTADKEFWMWGDIIGKHPELLNQMPKDITVLEWGYEQEHPFDANTTRIKKEGLDFVVCPGTSSWMTLTGRTDNMLGNIENAVLNGLKNGAKGMLLTDWGDLGHWQYLPISYPGFAYAGAISWNSASSKNVSLDRYLNRHVFENTSEDLAGIIMDMGRSYHYEERHLPNMSHNFMAYQFGLVDPVLESTIFKAIERKLPELTGEAMFEKLQARFDNQKQFQITALNDHLNNLEIKLNNNVDELNITASTGRNNEIKNELKNGIQMLRLGAEIRNYSQQKANWTNTERIDYLKTMQNRLEGMQKEHERLWLLRNKPGGLTRSMEAFKKIETQISTLLENEEVGGINKSVDRFKEKIIAGGANWYLN